MANGAAYQQLKAPDNSVSQALQFWGTKQSQENAANKASQEKKIADEKLAQERAGVRQAQSQAKQEENFFKGFAKDALTFEMSNNKNFNDIMTSYVNNAAKQSSDLMRQSELAYRSGNRQEAENYRNKYNNIKNSFKTISTLAPKIDEMIKWQAENKDNLNPFDNRFKFGDAIIKNNFLLNIDENGKLKMIVGLDKDKDGVISEEEQLAGDKYLREGFKTEGFDFTEIDPNDFASGAYQQYGKVDIQGKGGLLDKITSGIGVNQVNSITGDYETTTEFLTSTQKNTLRKALEVEMNDPETRAWVMNTVVGDTSKVDFSDEEAKKGVDELYDLAISKYGFKTETSAREQTVSEKQANIDRGFDKDDEKFQYKKGQDEINQANAKERLRLAQEGLDLQKKKFSQKGLTKEQQLQESSIYAFNVAKQLSEAVPRNGESKDDAIVRVAKELELPIPVDTNFDIFGTNEFELGGVATKDNDISKIAKKIADKLGLDYSYAAIIDNKGKIQTEKKPKEENKNVSSQNEKVSKNDDPLDLGI